MIDHMSTYGTDFVASKRFYDAVLSTPGPRPIYHAHYYGAFALDPDGNNVEAVCHAPA